MDIVTESMMLEVAIMMDKGLSSSDIAEQTNISMMDAICIKSQVDELCLLDEMQYGITEAPISRQERIVRGLRMVRKKRFLQMKKKIAQRKMPDRKKVLKLSRKSAINTLKTKIGKKSVASMSAGEKSRVEARVKKMGAVVTRLSRKNVAGVKAKAKSRIANRSMKKEDVTFIEKMNSALLEIKNEALMPTKKADDPCWKGYKQVGMKDKDGKQVPNCVPIDESATNEGGSE